MCELAQRQDFSILFNDCMKETIAFLGCGALGFTAGGLLAGPLGPFGGFIGFAIFVGGYMIVTKESGAEYRARVEEKRLGSISEHPEDR